MQKWIILIIIFLIAVLGIIIVLNVDIETEYVPEAEIEDEELRKTIVTLYFKDKVSGELAKESRLIDSKELLKNPYEKLVELLLIGPENSNYDNTIPEGTTLIEASITNGCVKINLSKEFKENVKSDIDLKNAKYSIFNTLSELTEVISIKILIDGVEVDGVSDIIDRKSITNALNISANNAENNTIDNTNTENNI